MDERLKKRALQIIDLINDVLINDVLCYDAEYAKKGQFVRVGLRIEEIAELLYRRWDRLE